VSVSARIGPYRVLRLINAGGHGRVYLGYDSRLRRQVAIKVHHTADAQGGSKRQRREAQLVASIDSPRVVKIHDLVVGSDNIALIMEYVPGVDLEELLGNVRLSIVHVLTIATDLAAALASARRQHITHGDVKARNVLVTTSGRVKLTDFGISRRGSHAADDAREAGSASCVSPEQYRGLPIDVRSDLFALGCLMYRMLTGRAPFVINGQLDVRALLEDMPTPVEELVADLPKGLSQLVASLLQKEAAQRPRDTQPVRCELRKILKELPLSASGTLFAVSERFFRKEFLEDLPPAVPPDLQRGRLSLLHPFQLDKLASWRGLFARQNVPHILALVAIAVVSLSILAVQLYPGDTRLHIEQPVIQIESGMLIPAGVSPHWLVGQIEHAAKARLGSVIVAGPVGGRESRTLRASAQHYNEEHMTVALRCRGQWCLLVLARPRVEGVSSKQAVLLPEMPLSEWSRNIQALTLQLFP
jgi:serine/threonine protein kinase